MTSTGLDATLTDRFLHRIAPLGPERPTAQDTRQNEVRRIAIASQRPAERQAGKDPEFVLATWNVKSQSYDFKPGPRYCVTDILAVQKPRIEFTEIGADGNPIDGRVKEKDLRKWDAPSLNNKFAIAQANGDGTYGKGGRAGAILKTMIEKELANKRANPTPQARGRARKAARVT